MRHMQRQRRKVPLMPLYFFHCKTDDLRYVDDDGIDLPDLVSAHAFAQEFVRDAKSGCRAATTDWSRYAVEITDDGGRLILTVPFTTVCAGRLPGPQQPTPDAGADHGRASSILTLSGSGVGSVGR